MLKHQYCFQNQTSPETQLCSFLRCKHHPSLAAQRSPPNPQFTDVLKWFFSALSGLHIFSPWSYFCHPLHLLWNKKCNSSNEKYMHFFLLNTTVFNPKHKNIVIHSGFQYTAAISWIHDFIINLGAEATFMRPDMP